jgi:hypothetical protein
VKAGHWLTGYNTLSGCGTVPGASARVIVADPRSFADVLPFYEWLSKADPFFGRMAELSLRCIERHRPPAAYGGHLVTPVIWAMLEAGKEGREGDIPPWQLNRTELYGAPQRAAVFYAFVSRRYQTGIVFANGVTEGGGRNWPLKGLQTWAWGDEDPILFFTNKMGSSTYADGLDTGRENVDRAPGGDWEVVLAGGARLDRRQSELATIAERRKAFWTLYAFTPVSTLVAYGGAKGGITSRWVINNLDFAPLPQVDAARRQVSFQGRKGSLCYFAGEAKTTLITGRNPTALFEVTAPPPVNVFGFSDGSLELGTLENEVLTFRDASGRYQLSLKDILGADGNLNRAAGNRLTVVSEP